jgi:hypothetical protein
MKPFPEIKQMSEESLLEKLKRMGADVRGKCRETIDKIILMVSQFISKLKEWASKTKLQVVDY